MKKIIATALSILVGVFGYTIADKELSARVDELEASVSSMQEEISSLHAYKPIGTTSNSHSNNSNSNGFFDDWFNESVSDTTTEYSGVLTTHKNLTLPNMLGYSTEDAKNELLLAGFKNITLSGTGKKVVGQYPFPGTYSSTIAVTLYLGE